MGITILMAEQDIGYAFDLSTRNYVLSQGKLIAEGSGPELLEDELIRETFFVCSFGAFWCPIFSFERMC